VDIGDDDIDIFVDGGGGNVAQKWDCQDADGSRGRRTVAIEDAALVVVDRNIFNGWPPTIVLHNFFIILWFALFITTATERLLNCFFLSQFEMYVLGKVYLLLVYCR
jgi:hypothetical protein